VGSRIYCLQNKPDPVAVYQRTVGDKVFLCDDGSPLDAVAAVVPGQDFAVGLDGFRSVAVAVANVPASPVLTAEAPSDKALQGLAALLMEKTTMAVAEVRSEPTLMKVYQTRVPKSRDVGNDMLSFVGKAATGPGIFEVTVDGEPATKGKVSGTSVTAEALTDSSPDVSSKIVRLGKVANK
jgi:hypothetical protein